MVKRKAGDNDSRDQKRYKPIALTVLELRSLLDPYKDDDSADVIFKDQKNHATLQRLYESLRRFSSRHKPDKAKLKQRAEIDNSKAANFEVPKAVSRKFSSWARDPHLFWWPVLFHSVAPKTPFTTEIYRQRFVQAAIEQYPQLQVQRVVARFTSIVVYLSFRRVCPTAVAYLKTDHIRQFLQFMGCGDTQGTITSCKSIITAGKRRITFCDALAQTDHSTSISGRSHDANATIEEGHNGKDYKRTLGIYFLDIIPDSICEQEKPLRKRDFAASIDAVQSINALDWLSESKTNRLANILLDYQHELLWTTDAAISAAEDCVASAEIGSPRLHRHEEISAPACQPDWVAPTNQVMGQHDASKMMSLLKAAQMAQPPEDSTNSTPWPQGTMPLGSGLNEGQFDGSQSVGTDLRPAEGYYMDVNQLAWFYGSTDVVGEAHDDQVHPGSFDVNASCQMSSAETESTNYHIDTNDFNWFSRLTEVTEQ